VHRAFIDMRLAIGPVKIKEIVRCPEDLIIYIEKEGYKCHFSVLKL